mmetsp:Transcript_3614/g.10651  ORF Transcript_3614/g.10651 Transcript_3614/m.10651 type:complete len:279 (+) Transcript_3614:19-855(+)
MAWPVLAALVFACATRPSQDSPLTPVRIRGRKLRSRTVGDSAVYVVELAQVSDLVAKWSHGPELRADGGGRDVDPFGVVVWPGAAALARLLSAEAVDNNTCEGVSSDLNPSSLPCGNARIMELGCGTGACSLLAASLGAKRVIASDQNPLTLELVAAAAQPQGLDAVTTRVFDMCSSEPLPSDMDFLLAADVCYNDALGRALGRRVEEAMHLGIPSYVADSVNIARNAFIDELQLRSVPFIQKTETLSFVGHAVSLDMEVERASNVALFAVGLNSQVH